jgi:hypothetical protein
MFGIPVVALHGVGHITALGEDRFRFGCDR